MNAHLGRARVVLGLLLAYPVLGDDCIIRAFPRGKGLGGFAMVGSPKGFGGNMYFNPTGPDMIRATRVTERGYEGKGFRR
jgi:hypothetical protein